MRNNGCSVRQTSNTTHALKRCACRLDVLLLAVSGLFVGAGMQIMAADSESSPGPPAFKQLRYDESYAYLRDPARRADRLDPIKFMPFTANGGSYLTLGGEIRERYEYYHNSQWGLGTQDDDGYLLQ